MMTDFIADALELCPHPAVIFEAPGLRYVASNGSATRYLRALLFDGEDAPELVPPDRVPEAIGLHVNAISTLTNGSYTQSLRDGSLAHLSLLRPGDQPRPPLIVCSVHEPGDEHQAWVDHNRVVLAVKVNEYGSFVMSAMETAALQLHAAISAQQHLLHSFNGRLMEVFARNPPPGSD